MDMHRSAATRMAIHLQFSENIGTVITDGVHPPFRALACPIQVKLISKKQSNPSTSWPDLLGRK